MNIKNKKIIVTGGSGFIGSHLVEDLVKSGAIVTVIDIKCLDKSYFIQQNLQKQVDLELIDIALKNRIMKLFTAVQPEYVFHLAAEAIVNESYNDPYRTFQTNVMGTVSVLEAARNTASVKGVIVASSDKAYGKTNKAYTEESPLQGDHPYDVSKSCTDLITQSYYKTYQLPVVISRFGNVYGEGDMHLDRLIPGICRAIIEKKVFEIRSDGTYVRDFLYVKDVVAGYLLLLEKFQDIKGEAFNFSSDDTLSVIDVIRKVENILNIKIPYSVLNTAVNEIPYQHLNDNKIRKLGWKSVYNLDRAFLNTLEWYKNKV